MIKKDNALQFIKMCGMVYSDFNYDIPKEKNQRKNKPKNKIIPKGLQEFIYGDTIIYALNKKNADRKALKQGLITKNQKK